MRLITAFFIKEWTCWRGFFFTVCPLITTNVKLMLFFKKSLLIFFYFAPPFPVISNIILDRTPSSTSWIIKSYAFPMPPSFIIKRKLATGWIDKFKDSPFTSDLIPNLSSSVNCPTCLDKLFNVAKCQVP